MSECILEYLNSEEFDSCEEKTEKNYEINSDSPIETLSYFPINNEELEAIELLQKELSSPASSTCLEDSPEITTNLGLKFPSQEAANFYYETNDIDMIPQDSPSSTRRSQSPLSHVTPYKPQPIQLLEGLDFKVREDQLASMKISEISKIAGVRFTKNEEKEVKRLRRKIKNKLSAAQSRQKMKDYVSGLEERVESVTQHNIQLKQRVAELELENKQLRQKLSNNPSTSTTQESNGLLQEAHRKTTNSNKKQKTGIYLLMVFLSFGLFYGMSQNFDNSTQISMHNEDKYSHEKIDDHATGLINRRLLFEKEIFMMDTEPYMDHTLNDSEGSFWDAYFKHDSSSFTTIDKKHDIIFNEEIFNQNSFCEKEQRYTEGLTKFRSQPYDESCSAPSNSAVKIKGVLESLDCVERVFCGEKICVVRFDEGDSIL